MKKQKPQNKFVESEPNAFKIDKRKPSKPKK